VHTESKPISKQILSMSHQPGTALNTHDYLQLVASGLREHCLQEFPEVQSSSPVGSSSLELKVAADLPPWPSKMPNAEKEAEAAGI